MKGNLFIVSSPSGGGKGTLIKEVLKSVPNVGYSISYTTRKKRDGEEHGKDYFFVDPNEFENLIKKGEFLEYAAVHNNLYGTSASQVDKEIAEGNDIILEIDVQGAKIVNEKVPNAIGIFILPPSYETLSIRLAERNTEDDESLRMRLNNAKQEVKSFDRFDYIVINEEIGKAAADLARIFLSERLRRDRQTGTIHDILMSFDNSENN